MRKRNKKVPKMFKGSFFSLNELQHVINTGETCIVTITRCLDITTILSTNMQVIKTTLSILWPLVVRTGVKIGSDYGSANIGCVNDTLDWHYQNSHVRARGAYSFCMRMFGVVVNALERSSLDKVLGFLTKYYRRVPLLFFAPLHSVLEWHRIGRDYRTG